MTFQYDKMLYLVEPSEENAHIAGEKILAFDYPNVAPLRGEHGSAAASTVFKIQPHLNADADAV